MRKVLHVGPFDTPGGMATVMQTLAATPPEGWATDVLSSHASGGPLAKWKAYRRARGELRRRCLDASLRPDVVHVHAASDWSLRRKMRLLRFVHRFNVAAVLHLHSGHLAKWLGSPDGVRAKRHRRAVAELGLTQVVLSEAWQRELAPMIGPAHAVANPVSPAYVPATGERDENHVLVLGRNDPVKGHAFAEEVVARLVVDRPKLRLTLTGKERSSRPFVDALGWVSEAEKMALLQRATVLLVPSSVEGQPLVILEALASGLPVVVGEHLHSLPTGVVRAGPTVEDWAKAVDEVLNGNLPPKVDVEPHRAFAVAKRWGELYDSLLKD